MDVAVCPGRLPGWLVAGIPALTELIVGGYKISGPSLWRDEASTISASQRPVSAIFALMRNQDAVHAPYYLLMHAVIGIGGISATALRLPSLIAMCGAVGLTAALGRRLAENSNLPAPSVIGLLAGLLLTAIPLTTRYAQEARPYALATLFAVLATYSLVRAAQAARGMTGHRWQSWALYSVALAVTGMLNLFALLLAAGHGVSLVAARRRNRPDLVGHSRRQVRARASDNVIADGTIVRWLAACAVSAVPLIPIAVFSAEQSSQVGWILKPTMSTVAATVHDFSGGPSLMPVAIVLGLLGCLAGRGLHRGGGLTLAVVAVPWLLLAPITLIAVSYVHPLYVERYVLFCLPALALLGAAGLVWLAWLIRLVPPIRRAAARRDSIGRLATALAVIPSAATAAMIAVLVISPQRNARLPGAKVDNIRAVAAVLGEHERPGDAILYMPWSTAVLRLAYPAPFLRLRDIALGQGPIASATIKGTPASASVLAARLRSVKRLWTVQWAPTHPAGGAPAPPASRTPVDVMTGRAVSKMRLIEQWHIASVILRLYAVE